MCKIDAKSFSTPRAAIASHYFSRSSESVESKQLSIFKIILKKFRSMILANGMVGVWCMYARDLVQQKRKWIVNFPVIQYVNCRESLTMHKTVKRAPLQCWKNIWLQKHTRHLISFPKWKSSHFLRVMTTWRRVSTLLGAANFKSFNTYYLSRKKFSKQKSFWDSHLKFLEFFHGSTVVNSIFTCWDARDIT